MSLFANLTTDNMEEATDTLGGGFQTLETDAYLATVKLAYAGKSQSGAANITVHADIDGTEFRETIYITNKKGENFYPDKQDAKKRHPLPGFTTIDDLCLLITGEPLAAIETEEKVVKLYNFEERKELPTQVQVLTPLLGKQVKLGILKIKEFKQKKNDAGVYVDTDETRTLNQIDKVFHAETGRTVNEYKQGVEDPVFLEAWTAKNKGQERDKTRGKSGGAGSTGQGRPGGLGQQQSSKTKLFGS